MIFLIAINMLRSKNFSIEIMDFDFNSLSRSQFRNTSQVLLCFHLGQIQLLENLYTSISAYKPKSEKKIFFPGLPCSQNLSYSPGGDATGFQLSSMPKNLEKVQNNPQPVKWATLLRKNPSYYYFARKQCNFKQPSL